MAIRLDGDVSRRIDAALAALGTYADSRRADRPPQRERDDALRSAAWQALDDLRELLADGLPRSSPVPRAHRRQARSAHPGPHCQRAPAPPPAARPSSLPSRLPQGPLAHRGYIRGSSTPNRRSASRLCGPRLWAFTATILVMAHAPACGWWLRRHNDPVFCRRHCYVMLVPSCRVAQQMPALPEPESSIRIATLPGGIRLAYKHRPQGDDSRPYLGQLSSASLCWLMD